jgi:hypothetical protein
MLLGDWSKIECLGGFDLVFFLISLLLFWFIFSFFLFKFWVLFLESIVFTFLFLARDHVRYKSEGIWYTHITLSFSTLFLVFYACFMSYNSLLKLFYA